MFAFIFSTIYVVWNERVRIYSVETGECVRDLDDNRDGSIVGLAINSETKKTLVGCTENGTVLTWKLDSYVISKKLVSLRLVVCLSISTKLYF